MTATASPFAHDTFASDPSGPDAIFTNSPPMTAYQPKFKPSPSPPPSIRLPKVSPSPSPGRKASNKKRKVAPSQGDGVLVHYLDGGRRPELAALAAAQPLVEEYVVDEGLEEVSEDDESHSSSSPGYAGSAKMSPEPKHDNGADLGDLKSLAGAAFALALGQSTTDQQPKSAEAQDRGENHDATPPQAMIGSPGQPGKVRLPPSTQPPQHPHLQPLQPRDAPLKPGLAMPITPFSPNGQPDFLSPKQPSASGLRHPGMMSPGISTASSHGELPPIMASPKSDTNVHTPLPSLPSIGLLSEQRFSEKDPVYRHPSFPHSPPGAGASRMSINPGITSPTSPNYPYAHSMPSPAQSIHSQPYGAYSSQHGFTPRTVSDYGSGTTLHMLSPGIEQNPTPISMVQDSRERMSIDHVTNSQIGHFECKFAGCNAPPFQTQYLLNSHANVHSSARPHYCPIKGCSRAEGGKGFKRKNEMIRHGLVHESPGYVCPFCPDREHKYPRPDNLQRHVRVHHVDKDKDDAKLREVLAQRPDGPNRGRRRRGVP